jgi:hypothetical protein
MGCDEGWLSDAIGIAILAFITLCDWAGVVGGDFLAFSFMYASNLKMTSVTRSFTVVTF